jgi:hypothetical protein
MKMKRLKRYKRFIFTKFFFVTIILFSAFSGSSQTSSLTVISNQKGAPSTLNFSELKSIFMGEQQRWRSGTKITIALMKTNTAAVNNTSETLYGISAD